MKKTILLTNVKALRFEEDKLWFEVSKDEAKGIQARLATILFFTFFQFRYFKFERTSLNFKCYPYF